MYISIYMTDKNNQNEKDEITKQLTLIRENIAPELEKLFEEYEIDYKAAVIFLAGCIRGIIRQIDNKQFNEVLIRFMFDAVNEKDKKE